MIRLAFAEVSRFCTQTLLVCPKSLTYEYLLKFMVGKLVLEMPMKVACVGIDY